MNKKKKRRKRIMPIHKDEIIKYKSKKSEKNNEINKTQPS